VEREPAARAQALRKLGGRRGEAIARDVPHGAGP
jgi:hypothetical protein